ncbi:pyrimidine reductase family protein [Pseudonocardiaceae bacterium YIM PH 21723]|nr:pyrimidine reductase family protein [Pseudonocardiaceae bacterium YIM PH 21723]
MRSLLPHADPVPQDELIEQYRYPAALERAYVRTNFVSSLDGGVQLDGKSGGLGNADDQRLLGLLRTLADVVLVGRVTSAAEAYGGVSAAEERLAIRAKLGLAPVPPIAVVTASCAIDPQSSLFSGDVKPIILTCEAAPVQRRALLTAAGADLAICGGERVDLPTALDALEQRGLYRVICEGGPHLAGGLATADLIDEICLTLSPMLAGGDALRMLEGPVPQLTRTLSLQGVLRSDDTGHLFLRYTR